MADLMGRFAGKVALVTGAGGMRGIGRACALRLAAEGADVVLSDVRRPPEDLPGAERAAGWRSSDSVAEEVRALGRDCRTVWCDLTDRGQIAQLALDAAAFRGHIDIVVNNARAIIGRDRQPVTDLDEATWDHFLAVNLTAVFLLTKHAGRLMVQQGRGGRIVNIASDASRRATPKSTAYSSSKFGVIGLTQASALDLAPHGITVNAVCPGLVDSGRMNYLEVEQAKAQGVSVETFRAKVLENAARQVPLGRVGVSEDTAKVVAFLASEDADFITGQALNVNGGTLFH